MLHEKQQQLIEVMSQTIKIDSIPRDYDPHDDTLIGVFLRIDGLELTNNDFNLIEELSIINQTIASYKETPELIGRGLNVILDARKAILDLTLGRLTSFEAVPLTEALIKVSAQLWASEVFQEISAVRDL